jgi:Tfp pilus assembly protein PilF
MAILTESIKLLMGLPRMLLQNRFYRPSLRTTALCSVALAFLAPYAAQAFDPNMEVAQLQETQASPSASTSTSGSEVPPIPTVAPVILPMPSFSFTNAAAAAPMVEPKMDPPEPKVVAMPTPLSAARAFPPVDAETARRAQQEMAAMPATAVIAPATIAPAAVVTPSQAIAPATAEAITAAPPAPTPQPGFVAPAPLLDLPPAPVVAMPATRLTEPPARVSAPTLAPETLASLPAEPAANALSEASKNVLSGIPSRIDTVKPSGGKLSIRRTTPELKPLAKNPKVDSFNSGGLSIKVQRPGLDTNFELNRAYTALMGGDTTTAIDIYKNILSAEPLNEDALFGLASTYHRLGSIDQARPHYATLLRQNPGHREGLNNFLSLISTESPEEALAELERLEQRNPDFSPIPAQQAVLLSSLGYHDRARDKMLRAIELSPDNLTYKYNLAIMMDKTGHYADASALYRLLIEAALHGQKIPASTDALQKRLNFIGSVQPATGYMGG